MRLSHWWLAGPSRAIPAAHLLSRVNVADAHVHTFRRLIRIGPIGIYMFRYAPGCVEEVRHGEQTP